MHPVRKPKKANWDLSHTASTKSRCQACVPHAQGDVAEENAYSLRNLKMQKTNQVGSMFTVPGATHAYKDLGPTRQPQHYIVYKSLSRGCPHLWISLFSVPQGLPREGATSPWSHATWADFKTWETPEKVILDVPLLENHFGAQKATESFDICIIPTARSHAIPQK